MNTPDATKMSKRMRKLGRRAYTDARVGIAKRTASRPEIDIGSRRTMVAATATGMVGGAAASMFAGRISRHRANEEDLQDSSGPRYNVPPASANGAGTTPAVPTAGGPIPGSG
jgi:hypothetical protein